MWQLKGLLRRKCGRLPGTGGRRSVANDDGIVSCDEVGGASFTRWLLLLLSCKFRGTLANSRGVPLAHGLPVAHRSPAAAAVQVDAICFESGCGKAGHGRRSPVSCARSPGSTATRRGRTSRTPTRRARPTSSGLRVARHRIGPHEVGFELEVSDAVIMRQRVDLSRMIQRYARFPAAVLREVVVAMEGALFVVS